MTGYRGTYYKAKNIRVKEAKISTRSGNVIYRNMSEEEFRKALDVLDKKYS